MHARRQGKESPCSQGGNLQSFEKLFHTENGRIWKTYRDSLWIMKYMYIAIYVLILDSVTFLIKNLSFTSHYLVVVFSLVSADYCRHFPSLAGQLQLIHSCLHSWAISVVLRKLGTWKRVLWILKIENSQLSGKHFVWRNILFQRWLHTPKSSLVLLAWKLPRTQPTPSEFFTGQASLAKCLTAVLF